MRILIATDSYKPNVDGVSVFLSRLTEQLVAKGHEVAVIAPSPTYQSFLEKDHGVVIFRQGSIKPIRTKAWFFSPFPYPTVYQAVKKFSPDVVHINLPFNIGLATLRAARRIGVPVVASCHTIPGNVTANFKFMGPTVKALDVFLWQYFRWFYNHCDFITTPTPTAIRMLNQDNSITKPLLAISNGIDTEVFRAGQESTKLRERLKVPLKTVVLYTGRLDKEKELDVLVGAMPSVLKEIPAHFMIAGEGTERDNLEKLARKLRVSSHLTFAGFLEEKEFPLIYNIASVFAISSPVELQSIVTLEAMSSGLPVVGVKAGALPELIQNGVNGFLFPEGSISKMAGAIVRILKDEELRRKFSRNSREIVVKKHSLEATAEKYLEVYRKVLEFK
ncbi:MAG: glycosyltransferase [Patescibacteria group bacterium]|nr:glycosyltransferase [Patescibacteria group bacterium]